ncbi:MAG: MBL fold metallo-hydrolase [Verrucomicrobia bacterium]|nr:MBL fold metallo-hydrolase [Verrucomicrobiota bacterium]
MPSRRPKPEHHVDMRLGEGWHKRNFLAEVVIPSLFAKRTGRRAKPEFPELGPEQLCLTWIGHASFLVQTAEHSILIDPNWAKWLKVIKRVRQPGMEIHDLPAIDLVLVTHAHFDHLDKKTLRAVASDQAIVVPEHVGGLVHGLGFNHVQELRHWQSFELGALRVTLTPARHWGARVLHDTHRGFGGFHIEYKGRSVFHCGDSAYFEGFREIGERLPVEIALLPIGAYDAPTKRDVHMNPEEAIEAFIQLQAKKLVPMHFGTFRLGYEPLHEPPERLLRHGTERRMLDQICILREGEPRVF